MHKADPAGAYKPSEQDPRIMVQLHRRGHRCHP